MTEIQRLRLENKILRDFTKLCASQASGRHISTASIARSAYDALKEVQSIENPNYINKQYLKGVKSIYESIENMNNNKELLHKMGKKTII